MGKRSDFERKPRDFYPTPFEAVEPLIKHLPRQFGFAEPCAGDGALCGHLEHYGGVCMCASDIEPQHKGIHKEDYETIGELECLESDFIITNPPWDRKILHPMIAHIRKIRPTWLLFDADWMHCEKIISVGRIKWFGNMTGKDNCAWYLFTDDYRPLQETGFYGRQ